MLTRLDDWLMDEKFQKWSDSLLDRYGVSSMVVAAALHAVSAACMWAPTGSPLGVVAYPLLQGMSFGNLTLALLCSGAEFLRKYERVIPFMNSARIEYASTRKSLLVLASILTLLCLFNKYLGIRTQDIAWVISGFWLTIVALYFYCCSTRPRKPFILHKPATVAAKT